MLLDCRPVTRVGLPSLRESCCCSQEAAETRRCFSPDQHLLLHSIPSGDPFLFFGSARRLRLPYPSSCFPAHLVPFPEASDSGTISLCGRKREREKKEHETRNVERDEDSCPWSFVLILFHMISLIFPVTVFTVH